MGSPRQEYWSGLPFPSLWDLPDPGIKPVSSSLAGGFLFFLTTDPLGKSSLDIQFSSVTQSCLDSLQPYGLQHTRHPCPSLTPRVYANSCPLSWWCHTTISSSVVPFSSSLQSLPASGSFPDVDSSHEVARVLEFQLQHQSSQHPGLISFRMDWLDLLAVQGTLKSLLQHRNSKASVLWHSAFFTVQLSHPFMTTEKTTALTRWTFVGKVMSLLFNMLSRLIIAFLPRSKHF